MKALFTPAIKTLLLLAYVIVGTNLAAFSQITHSQTAIKVYGVKLTAANITGFKGKIMAPDVSCLAPPLSIPINRTSLYALLGDVYSTYDPSHPKKLFNLEYSNYMPILDSINFSFYTNHSFSFVLDKEVALVNDNNYTLFKDEFISAKNNKARREILYRPVNKIYRQELEKSAFVENGGIITGNASRDLRKTFSISLSDSISGDLSKVASFKQRLAAQIRDSIQKHTSTVFAYHEISFKDEYLDVAAPILRKIYADGTAAKLGDTFSQQLADFFNKGQSAIVTGASVLEASFETTSFAQLTASITGAVNANLKKGNSISPVSLARAQAEISGRYLRSLATNMSAKSPNTFYNIRLAYSKDWEIGKGSTDSPDAVCD